MSSELEMSKAGDSENQIARSGSAINCTAICANSDEFEEEGVIARKGPPTAVNEFLYNSLSAATKRAYEADLAAYRAWGGTIPTTPAELSVYLAENARLLSVATLRRRVAALSSVHNSLGVQNPAAAEIVRRTMRGIRRTVGISQTEAKPLLKEDLFEVLSRMGDRPIDKRDKALLLIGFAGGFRRSELVNLDRSDIEHVRQGIVVSLRRSKTDQEGAGRKIGIPFGRTRLCPVRHLSDWLTHAGIEVGPIFRTVNRHGHVKNQRLSGEAVSMVVKDRARGAGFDPSGLSGHSLRAGLATSAAMAGASMWKIRAQTGHASDAMLSRYIRGGDMFLQNAAASVL
jgi:integrase